MVKSLPANVGDRRDAGSTPGWEDPWRRAWQPTPVFLPGESRGRRSLVGQGPQGRTESATSEVTEHYPRNTSSYCHSSLSLSETRHSSFAFLSIGLKSSWSLQCHRWTCPPWIQKNAVQEKYYTSHKCRCCRSSKTIQLSHFKSTKTDVLVCQGSRNKIPQIMWHKQQKFTFSSLEAGSIRPKCEQDGFLLSYISLACRQLLSPSIYPFFFFNAESSISGVFETYTTS